MEALFLKFFNMSIAAGWLILAVMLLRIVFKNAPKSIRRILWALVGIRLVVPFSPESFFSLIPSAETVSPDVLHAEIPEVHTGIAAFNTYVNPVISNSLSPVAGSSANLIQTVTFVASIGWFVGLVVVLSYGIISYVRLRRRMATAVLFRDNLWQSEMVASPFVLGFFRPRIYLPFSLDEENMAYIVAHESAHISLRDYWIKPFGFLLLAVYWFNPLSWLAYFFLCRDLELACDERVIMKMSIGDKKAYSKALLSYSVSQRAITACPLAFGEVGVKQRVKNVLNYKKPAFWVIAAALVVCAAVAVCFLTNPRTNGDPAEVVGKYDTGSLGGAFVTSGNPAYEIGVNIYGMPVFADTDAAFVAILTDCADGFAYLSKEFDLPAVTKWNYEDYKTYGWQAGAEDEVALKQCMEISRFFDIYENSFSTRRASTATTTVDENRVYSGGVLLGESGMLSSIGPEGDYYALIALSGDALTVVNDRGELVFASSHSEARQITLFELSDLLDAAYFSWREGYGMPDAKSITVYYYYDGDDSENAACGIYCFDGKPTWFAVGGIFRLYELADAIPVMVYNSQSCIYMNPLSSVLSLDDNGYRYLMYKDRFVVIKKETGETVESFSDIRWNWKALSEDKWKEMFLIDVAIPDISGYKKPRMLKLSDQYLLFDMDGTYWMGQCNGGKAGMWSIYSLALDETVPVV